MRTVILVATVLSLCTLSISGIAAEGSAPIPIIRKPLLTALIEGGKNIQRVEIKEIEFAPHQRTGLHLHPCPVVGYIVEGAIMFQVEGQSVQLLKAGDAFFEPANAKILQFDAGDVKAKLTAYFLLGANDHEIITVLQ